ncbi:hypothetical protein J2736_001781 [Paenibacillus qinlingensis]|uniref:Uncharacterized protein n=1 Tax=Paenibacillus qinlingensis TaxID=1837343 RepID=A0ABU1NTD3_9BACL|nr:hypothetical protein [Paenibacillus qinlingensis]
MFYYWSTGIICLISLVATLYVGFSRRNQETNDHYTKSTAKNLNGLLVLNVLFVIVFSLFLVYWIWFK